MASITHWNRLEPRPRARDLNDTLAAKLRDPLWLLTRQWQFGEFRGEDAGSPAFVRIVGSQLPISAWRIDNDWQPYDGSRPIETLLQAEPFPEDDLSLQVEIAEYFAAILRGAAAIDAAVAEALLADLRTALPLALPDAVDVQGRQFHAVCAPRLFNGIALYRLSQANPPALPAGVVVPGPQLNDVQTLQRALVAWVHATFGAPGAQDPASWRAERLEYLARMGANDAPPRGPDNVTGAEVGVELVAHPELEGALEWYALEAAPAQSSPPRRGATEIRHSLIPIHVGFRGMPNARWWDFESGETDFGDLRADRRDVAKLVVMNFMLVQGNDWFVIPLEQDIGSIARIDTLSVTDVFGDTVYIDRADRPVAAAEGRWTLFTCSRTAEMEVLPHLVLPPTAGAGQRFGTPLEEVRFFRDEMANMVWAVEHTIQDATGDPWSGHERAMAIAPPAAGGGRGPLTYIIQSDVARNWIPFIPVSLDPVRGEIALERGGMTDALNPGGVVKPVGRILRPTSADPYRVREEEISRAGVRIVRRVVRARWTDGSTWLWMTRQRRASGGEGASGLRFDVAEKS
jgi:hypothetical protein